MSSIPRPVQSVSNGELYNRWAKVYDTDGNILQALDDALLPAILDHVLPLLPNSSPLAITELGCGTGRNTIKLLSSSLLPRPIAQINALDLSPGMLSIARERCSNLQSPTSTSSTHVPSINFQEFDALHPAKFPDVQALYGTADLVISTLVLEHLPLDVFFRTIKDLLRKEGGCAVITNMHAEMGRIGQAGFVDEETGNKVRGESFVYEIQEVLQEGKKWGFEPVGEVGERGIREEDVGDGRLVGARGKKMDRSEVLVWIGTEVAYFW